MVEKIQTQVGNVKYLSEPIGYGLNAHNGLPNKDKNLVQMQMVMDWMKMMIFMKNHKV